MKVKPVYVFVQKAKAPEKFMYWVYWFQKTERGLVKGHS